MMEDLIKREDAIDEIRKESQELHSMNVIPLATVGAMVDAIVRVPAVEPKQGEWIYVTVEEWRKTGRDYGHHCSECDEINESGKSNYCPNCGAKMSKGTDNDSKI